MRVFASQIRSFNASDDGRYWCIGQVREHFGVSAEWVRRHIQDHGFPKPVRFGSPKSARHWRVSDVLAWEAERARVINGDAA